MRLSTYALAALLGFVTLGASPSLAHADDAVAGEDDDFFKTDDKPKPPDVPDASAFNPTRTSRSRRRSP